MTCNALPDGGAGCSHRLLPHPALTDSTADVIQTDDVARAAFADKIDLCVQQHLRQNSQPVFRLSVSWIPLAAGKLG